MDLTVIGWTLTKYVTLSIMAVFALFWIARKRKHLHGGNMVKENKQGIIKIVCDAGCKKQFSPDLKEVPCEGGIKQSFVCPHCKRVYNICKISKRGLEIRKQIQVATAKGDWGAVTKLQKAMKSEVVSLSKNTGGGGVPSAN